MLGGIDKQQHTMRAVQQAQTTGQAQQATPLSKLTGGKTKQTEKSSEEDKTSHSGDGASGSSEDASSVHLGSMVGGMLKSKGKSRQKNVDRRLTSAGEAGAGEDVSETGETKSASKVKKAGMEETKSTSQQKGVSKVVKGLRISDNECESMSVFINDWLKIKRSPGYSFDLGDIMVEEGMENEVEPFILLSIAGAESDYGKKPPGVDGFMGTGDKTEGPEEQIAEGAMRFNMLREKGESQLTDPASNQIQAVSRAGWTEDPNWHKQVFRHYQEIKRAWERYLEMLSRR